MVDTEAVQVRLQELQRRSTDCAQAMRDAAEALFARRHGPARGLVDELRTLNEEYTAIRHAILPEDRQDDTSAPTFEELKAACSQLHTRQMAVNVVDRVLLLARGDGAPFAPLEQCQLEARRLRSDLLASHSVRTMQVAQSLLSGEHPLAALLELVTLGSILSDEQWARQQDVVIAACGRELAVAVARRKLVCRTVTHGSLNSPGANGSLIAPV